MRKERILIIDDDPDIRDVLDLSLSEHYAISVAGNGKEGLEMVAVTNESARTVRSYLKNKDFRFPILLDQKEKLFDRFKIDRFPTTLVIDQSGKLALRHVGPTDWNSPSIISTLHSLISQNADQ